MVTEPRGGWLRSPGLLEIAKSVNKLHHVNFYILLDCCEGLYCALFITLKVFGKAHLFGPTQMKHSPGDINLKAGMCA